MQLRCAGSGLANGKVGIEDILLAQQTDTEAFYDGLESARILRRAIESAQRAGKREAAVLWQMKRPCGKRSSAIATGPARRRNCLGRGLNPDLQTLRFNTGAIWGCRRAQIMSDDLVRRYPLDTLINGYWLPTFALSSNSITTTRPKPSNFCRERSRTNSEPSYSRPVGLSPSSAYVRGEAYLRLRRGKDAAAEYQKFVDHWGA